MENFDYEDFLDMENELVIIPEHACSYCSFADEKSCCFCITCSKWFCNSIRNFFGSHIVYHLARSHHVGIQLHRDNIFGDIVLECYNCNSRNIFNIGYLPATEESAVVLLCRNCLRHPNTKNLGWDVNAWAAIIQDKSILEWILSRPNASTFRNPDPSQLMKLEEQWKTDPKATLDQISEIEDEDEILPVKLYYDDPQDYAHTFLPLVMLESDNTKKLKTSCNQDGVTVKWIKTINSVVAEFYSKVSDEDILWDIFDELMISTRESLDRVYNGKGNIISIDDGKISVQMYDKRVPDHISTGYRVEYVGNEIPFTRMIQALKTFKNNTKAMGKELKKEMLGTETHNISTFSVDLPTDYNIRQLPELNSSQIMAIKSSLLNAITLVQGPPGTGKTVTSASIVYHIVKQFKEQILVCAPSNIAVDHLTEKIEQTGLRVVRIVARNKEEVLNNVKGLLLHKLILQLPKRFDELRKLAELKERTGELDSRDEKKYKELKSEAEHVILKNAEVICCTCSCAGDSRLSRLEVKHVLIDEAAQAPEPDSLIPIVKGCEHLILVGDHKQLGPVIMDEKAKAAGFNKSLFERFIKLKYKPIVLTVQYRMHPKLAIFPSEAFYSGSLQNGVTESQRYMPKLRNFPFPNPSVPMLFISCNGIEELSSSGTSYLNRQEAESCEEVVSLLLDLGFSCQSIGVISPYEGQRVLLQRSLEAMCRIDKDDFEKLEIKNVDAFQGREKDFIVLSCVRSNDQIGIGFLKDIRRMNVAITRAKYGLILIGNASVLVKNPVWNQLLYHYQQLNCIIEGKLSRQSPYSYEIPKPMQTIYKNDYEFAMESNETDLDKEKLNDFLLVQNNLKRDPIPENVPNAWVESSEEEDEDDKKLIELDF